MGSRNVNAQPPADTSAVRARERAAAILAASQCPLSSAGLAAELLGLVRAPETVCLELLRGILGADGRFEHTAGEGWRLREAPSVLKEPAPSLAWPWAVWAFGPGLNAVAVVRLELGAVVAERFETRPRTRAHGGTLSKAALARLGRTACGTVWAAFETRAIFTRFETLLRSSSLSVRRTTAVEASRPPVILLPRLAAALLGSPRPASIGTLASCLGMEAVVAEDPLMRARAAAECLLRLLEDPRAADLRTPEDLASLRPHGLQASAWLSRTVDRHLVRSLPSGPGVYRFRAADGTLLYVGKARNLRRRVGSYFLNRSRPDPRTAPWLGRVASIEVEEAGSEPEALVREAESILRSKPSGNTQRSVHARRGHHSGSLVLLQPVAGGKAVVAHLLRDGAALARVRLGPRGSGEERLLRLLQTLYFAEPGRRSETDRSKRAGALLTSWIARQAEPVPAFDPTDTSSPREAFALALRYAESLRRGEQGVIYRR